MERHVGTSGYSYKEWKGSFYPEDLPNTAMFSYYGERLGAVEINNTFYRLPNASVLESWADQVPDGFRFSIKASRKITHFMRLKAGTQEPTEYLLSTLDSLGDHRIVHTAPWISPPAQAYVRRQRPPAMGRDREGPGVGTRLRFFKHEDDGEGPEMAGRFAETAGRAG